MSLSSSIFCRFVSAKEERERRQRSKLKRGSGERVSLNFS